MASIKILKGEPTKEEWHEIVKLFFDGQMKGTDNPKGIDWEVGE